MSAIQQLIDEHSDNLAFVLGNGINRYGNSNSLSWDELLMQLWTKVSKEKLAARPEGCSLTEFYDVLNIKNKRKIDLGKEVSSLLKKWQGMDQHKRMVNTIAQANLPLLTTNFDETLASTAKMALKKIGRGGFSDFYPWNVYHGTHELESTDSGFGVWYVNGLIYYPRSIRLGLSQYMGSVERARSLIQGKKETGLYAASSKNPWGGKDTWLDLIFHKSLCFIGLGLEENETFLRWLLIERVKYFNKFPDQRKAAWYVHPKSSGEINPGKKFFLNNMGIEVLEVADFDAIYGATI